MPRKPTNADYPTPKPTEAEWSQLVAVLEDRTAHCGETTKKFMAPRRLARYKRRSWQRQRFIKRAWAVYVDACDGAVGDWNAFVAWLKEFWDKYGEIIIRIAVSVVFMLLI